MPLSHKLKAVFVHVPKVAGSSITAVMRSIDPNLTLSGLASPGVANVTQEIWLHHLPARHLIEMIDPECWSNYFKFAFVRNPYDLLVSYYFYQRRRVRESAEFRGRYPHIARMLARDCTFADWLPVCPDIKPQACFICDSKGNIAVDFVGRYESLSEDFAAVASRLGLNAPLPHLRRSEHGPWADYYTADQRALVRRRFEQDFDLLGYETSGASQTEFRRQFPHGSSVRSYERVGVEECVDQGER
jgi:chondroitin 4-sulfotransferase 11